MLRLVVDHSALLTRIAKRYRRSGPRRTTTLRVFETRLSAYAAQTAPLLPYYELQGKLVELDGMADIAAVAAAIDGALEKVGLESVG